VSKPVSRFQYLPIFALAITFIVGGYFYEKTLDSWLSETVSGYMLSLLKDVEHEIEEEKIHFYDLSTDQVDDFLDDLPQASAQQRFTIIHESGKVLGDSNLTKYELRQLEDHSQRPEVLAALKNGQGIAKRFSESVNQNLLYVAIRLNVEDEEHEHEEVSEEEHSSVYVLRGAMPMTSLHGMAADLRVIIYLLMGCSMVVLIASSWFSNRKIARVIDHQREIQEDRISKSTREIELLRQLANTLAACTSIEEARLVVKDITPRIIGNINGCVSIMRESRNLLEVEIDWGEVWPAATAFPPSDCWALRKGKYHLSREKNHNLSCTHMGELSTEHTTMCIPLIAHGNTVGVFHLCFANSETNISIETRALAFTLAEHLGLALANLRLQEKLRSQAMRDPLTGLYNRRYFEERLDREWFIASQKQSYLSMFMLDLDHFKRFNDNFGHDAGDYVLKEMGSLLNTTIKERGTVCRIGGEEFAVFCANLDEQQSICLAEDIIELVRELHLDIRGISLGQLGISVGIATFPDADVSAQELVKLADNALYEAKDRGRGQAVHTNKIAKKENDNSV
jgi:diguanylate cyclase (GGDEF)-like protein